MNIIEHFVASLTFNLMLWHFIDSLTFLFWLLFFVASYNYYFSKDGRQRNAAVDICIIIIINYNYVCDDFVASPTYLAQNISMGGATKCYDNFIYTL